MRVTGRRPSGPPVAPRRPTARRAQHAGVDLYAVWFRPRRAGAVRRPRAGERPRVRTGFHAVVPAGGAGTRLWPLSRAGAPKFLLDLTGSGRTLLQQTWDRLRAADRPRAGPGRHRARPHAARRGRASCPRWRRATCSPSRRRGTRRRRSASPPRCCPPRRRTRVLGSFAADHVIADRAPSTAAVREAVARPRGGYVVTIGIAPTHAATAFGYVRLGQRAGRRRRAERRAAPRSSSRSRTRRPPRLPGPRAVPLERRHVRRCAPTSCWTCSRSSSPRPARRAAADRRGLGHRPTRDAGPRARCGRRWRRSPSTTPSPSRPPRPAGSRSCPATSAGTTSATAADASRGPARRRACAAIGHRSGGTVLVDRPPGCCSATPARPRRAGGRREAASVALAAASRTPWWWTPPTRCWSPLRERAAGRQGAGRGVPRPRVARAARAAAYGSRGRGAHRVRAADRARLRAGAPARVGPAERLGAPGRLPVHPRRAPHDVRRPPLDDAAVRRVRHRARVQRPLPPARGGRHRRAVGGLRPADADGLRLRHPMAAGEVGQVGRRDRPPWTTCARCSTASRWSGCRRR